jgi:ribosomal protein S21
MIEARKKEGENVGAFIFRFNKKVKQSGIMKEIKKRKFTTRNVNRNKRRSAALYRVSKMKSLSQSKKYGNTPGNKNS